MIERLCVEMTQVVRVNRRLLIALLLLLPSCAGAQTREDACLFVPFPRDMAVDYELAMAKLTAASEQFRAAELALSKARLALTSAIPKDLYEARYKADTLRMKSLASETVAGLRGDVAKACVERIDRYPAAEAAARNRAAQALEALARSADQFKQEAGRIEREYGTADAALTSLKRDLQAVQRSFSAVPK